jgi:hypothetical protein
MCGEPSSSPGFDFARGNQTTAFKMANDHSSENHLSRSGGTPLVAAIAIAVLGVLGILIVDHGPWNKPKVQPAVVANYSTTGEAARAAGARVMPTEPKMQLEPDPPGPDPVHPVNPSLR